ncbi:MAG: hypothetical protein IV085_08640 [Thiobacillus sp.]|nr:hypothetical protein [Thiobacillus sp.]
MGLIVGLTGAAGLLFSFIMLELGVTSMTLRYPLALLAAYGVFLVLLWLWLRTKAEDWLDIPDLSGSGSRGSGECSPSFEGGGGNFGGGGASGAFDGPASFAPVDSDSSPLSEAATAVDGADELAIPLLAVLFALGLALASLYVVYLAPMLFAELLVDGALSYALYRRMKAADSPHWLESAVRRTALPFMLTGVFVAATGAAMAAYAPGAHSIGQVMDYQSNNR